MSKQLELKYCKISDLENATMEEIKHEIHRLSNDMLLFNSEQMALKYFMNSVYGAFANEYFTCYDSNMAETITRQGQNLIKYCEKYLNNYLNKKFPTHTEVHKKMGITIKNPTPHSYDHVAYMDTDSVLVSFEKVIQNTDWNDSPVKFIQLLYDIFLKQFLSKILDKYSEQFNTDNLQLMELEAITYNSVFLGKKKYLYDYAWKMSGVSYKNGKKIVAKGVEMARTDTPIFARKHLLETVKMIFESDAKIKFEDIVVRLKEIKKLHKLEEIENISYSTGMNNYKKYIVDDRTTLKFMKGCPVHVKAAGTYNVFLNKNQKLKQKYKLIFDGNRIRYYYTKGQLKYPTFAFLPGEFPYEIAPDIDREIMFSKTIIKPLSRVTEALYGKKIPDNLVVLQRLF